MTTEPQQERHEFQTEVQQLLQLMIHSLYSDKEIFLRELISNASDACDKLRFNALTDASLTEGDQELAVQISVDAEDRLLTISDNGIGMTRDEVVENLGTIARSGTRQFAEALTGDEAEDASLIGQFGVGFYSAFMVASKVTVVTRAPDGDTVKWESTGSGDYTLEPGTRDTRGTDVILELREDESEFLEPMRLRHIISKYSDHISLPIQLRGESEDGPGNWETVNDAAALWARPRNEISEDDYNAFYTSLAYDPAPPLSTIHNRVEGNLEYISLFFIPAKAPFDLWDRQQRHGIKLYVRRIFITDDSDQLLPSYLRFIRGIVDAADLPLNVSREFLQNNRDIERIKNASVKKILGELKSIANDDENPDRYNSFWDEFGRAFKEGMVEDAANQTEIASLLRFSTTHDDSEQQRSSLDDYIERMPETQKSIYYVTADTFGAAKSSPHLEVFRKNNIEVLLLGEPIDEWVVNHLPAYSDVPLKSVAKGDLDAEEISVDNGTEAEREKANEDFADLVTRTKEVLGERIKDARLTWRLTDSPACLVADENDMGANLERILKAAGQDSPTSKPIFEINPEHAIVKRLDGTAPDFEDWINVLFDQAALSEGAPIESPAEYVKRVNALLSGSAAQS